MEQIKVQFTNPDTGVNQFDFLKFDIFKFRSDGSDEPHEDFFLGCDSAAVAALSTKRQIPDIAEAAIAANPFNPFGVASVAFSLVNTKATSSATDVVVKDGSVFSLGDVIAILSGPSTVVKTATITGIAGNTLSFGAALGVDVLENFAVVKLVVPTVFVEGFTLSNDTWGAKTLLEAPAKPTIAEGSTSTDSYGVTTVDITVTAPTTRAYVIKEYFVYVVNATEAFDPKAPFIAFNRKPDAITTTAGTTQVNTFGGGVNAGGGNMEAGTYYVVAISRDSVADAANCSVLSNILTITV